MEIVSESVGERTVRPSAAEVGGTARPEAAAEIAVPSKRLEDGLVLKGGGIVGVARMPKGLPGATPSETEVFLCISQQMYESMKAIIANLKPSEREKKNIHRRQEEIKKLQEKLRNRKIDLAEARMRFINMLDHEDVAEFSKQADREGRWLKG